MSGQVLSCPAAGPTRALHLDNDNLTSVARTMLASPSLLQGSPGGEGLGLAMPTDAEDLNPTTEYRLDTSSIRSSTQALIASRYPVNPKRVALRRLNSAGCGEASFRDLAS